MDMRANPSLDGSRTVYETRVLANVIQRVHKDWKKIPSIQRSFYLLNARTICAIFLRNRAQVIDGFTLFFLQRYVRRGNDTKNRAIVSIVTEPNESTTNFWPLWWRASLSRRVQTLLNHFDLFFCHNINVKENVIFFRARAAWRWREQRCLNSYR